MNGAKAATEGCESILGLLIRKVPSVVIGVLAAVVTVLVIDHMRAGTAAERKVDSRDIAMSPVGDRVVHTVVVDRTAFDRIADLERQVRDMKEARTAAAATSVTPGEEELDPAEVRQKVDEMYAELDRAHERDSADPQWAPGATNDLVTGLTSLGEKLGFTVGAADCKTTTCRATVNWRDYSTGRGTGVQLVERIFGNLACAQHMRLEEPTDPNAPYSTSLYLDCTNLRAGS